MLGCYDFCGHYEWTFEWFRAHGGEPLVREYWDKAIAQDSQRPNYVYVGTKQSFYMSRDGGANWSRRGGNLPRCGRGCGRTDL